MAITKTTLKKSEPVQRDGRKYISEIQQDSVVGDISFYYLHDPVKDPTPEKISDDRKVVLDSGPK